MFLNIGLVKIIRWLLVQIRTERYTPKTLGTYQYKKSHYNLILLMKDAHIALASQ